MTKHLFEDIDTGNGDTKANGHTPPAPAADTDPAPSSASSPSPASAKSEDKPAQAGDKAPFDPDAT